MHGRLKVKTTAQQQEEKRIEREKKAKIFVSVMKQIFHNREDDEQSDSTLQLTQQILSNNPDVYTLWNIRKEIFVKKLDSSEDGIDKFLQDELDFVQSCLRVNPKSYGVWNQRRYVMLTMKEPNWNRELQLCNLFLQYDERNFHCWDYRRFVVKESNVSAEEELTFTTDKIKENFSNYSSWHNRSRLLPQVHPDPADEKKVNEEQLLNEFDFVQNAFFTDPNDQSAWFYQRWLLGRKKEKPSLLSVSMKRQPPSLIASFSYPVQKSDLSDTAILMEETIPLHWSPICNKKVKHANTWISILPEITDNCMLRISFDKIDQHVGWLELSLEQGSSEKHLCWNNALKSQKAINLFSDTHTNAKTSVLENELEACRMLLEEEPENKWTMATIIYLMKALDGSKHADEINDLISKLIDIDPLRKGYYKDLRSKYIIENKLQQICHNQESLEEVDLSNQDFTSFSHLEYFTACKKLNLQNNHLRNTNFLKMLPCLDSVNLTGNEDLDGSVLDTLVKEIGDKIVIDR